MKVEKIFTCLNYTALTLFFILSANMSFSQEEGKLKLDDFKNKSKTAYPNGIKEYEVFNAITGGDSIRTCEGEPCDGYVKDYHDNGQLKHKGYYEMGQLLTVYHNYYENGQLERTFRVVDDSRAKMKSYYYSGAERSKVLYRDGTVAEWEDYYENGQLQYQEINHKEFDYYVINKSFFPDGRPQVTLELVDKKDRIFEQKRYFENGAVKEEGRVQYSIARYDYLKIGTWKYYNEEGKLIKEQQWADGVVNKETEY